MVAMAMLGVVGGWVRSRLTQRRRDGRGLDGNDAGVHDLAVNLHHHLIALRRVVETLCGGGGIIRGPAEPGHQDPEQLQTHR